MNRQRAKMLPQIEILEDRCVPTTASLSRGVLRVTGTNAAEAIRINQAGAKIVVQGVLSVKTSQCRQIVVDAQGGNDVIDLRNVNVRATINAGTGNDFVVGSKAADVIFGSDGDDRLFGMTGNDTLCGDNGNDFLFGMENGDALLGGVGDDFLDDGNRGLQEYADGGAGLDWNADIVAVGGAAMDDIHQRGSPSCSFLSSLAGLTRGRDFTQWIRYAGFQTDGTPLYQVAFWQGTDWHWETVAFTGAMTNLDTAPAAEGESWVVLMNRAWMQYHGSNGRCWPSEAVYALTGVNPWTQGGVTNNDFGRIAGALDQGRLVIIATAAQGLSTSLLEGQHAYTVVGYRSDGWIQVRNPWGYDNDNGVASGNSSDGYIWLAWGDVMASFNYLAIA